jgi:uncharacterized membrane protein YozB (DUF420 family)
MSMPAINASLNALSGVLLLIGFRLIKAGNWRAHAYTMISATFVSTIFLACYLGYHYENGEKSTGLHPGALRDLYLAILFPHLLAALILLPMIAMTLWRAWNRDWVRHMKIAKPTFWVWLYVSVSGVVVYFMLYHTALAN